MQGWELYIISTSSVFEDSHLPRERLSGRSQFRSPEHTKTLGEGFNSDILALC